MVVITCSRDKVNKTIRPPKQTEVLNARSNVLMNVVDDGKVGRSADLMLCNAREGCRDVYSESGVGGTSTSGRVWRRE